MLLSRWDLVVDVQTAARYRQPQTLGRKPIGAGGVVFPGHSPGWEPNVKYTDGKWHQICRHLARCPPVATATSAQMDLMMASRVTVGGRKPDARASELLRRQYGLEGRPPRMRRRWESFARGRLRAVHQGVSVAEYTYRNDENDQLASRFGTVYVDDFLDRTPATVLAWLVDDDQHLVGIRQMDTRQRGRRVVDIPISQLLVLSHDMEGSTAFDGLGLWRCAADDAYDFNEIGNLLRAGARSWAVGETDIVIDTKAALDDNVIEGSVKAWEAEQRDLAIAWGEGRFAGEAQVLARSKYWTINVIGGREGYDPYALVKQRFSNAEVVYQRLNAEFTLIGSTQAGGSYNAAESKIDRAAGAAENLMDWFLGELDENVNRQLIKTNFPDLDPEEYPVLEASRLRGKIYVQKMAEVVQLAQLGGLPLYVEDAPSIRADLEMRPVSPGDTPLTLDTTTKVDTSVADKNRTGQRGPQADRQTGAAA